jgi:hypothetical protein
MGKKKKPDVEQKKSSSGKGITVCLRCGSTNISHLFESGFDLGFPPIKVICKDCGWQGIPIVLDSEEDRKKFLETIKEEEGRGDKVRGINPEFSEIAGSFPKDHYLMGGIMYIIIGIVMILVGTRNNFIWTKTSNPVLDMFVAGFGMFILLYGILLFNRRVRKR